MRFPRGRSRLADTPQQVLKRYFGFDAFRPNQEEIVDSILAGRDVLGVMPTGAGKSVCYQVPALVMGGCTLVVSPLISLMADQVSALEQAGVNAVLVNSTLSAAQQRAVLAGVAKGGCTLLYVAPERLDDPRFQEFVAGNPPSMVAIDEAHCISQWGQDFRPSYTRIDAFIEDLPERPVVCAFTATATSAVRRDILASLRLRDPFVVVASFDRPNLHFEVQRPQRKAQALVALCRKHEGGSGIVYCSTRKKVEEVCDLLCGEGFAATRYHAGLPTSERTVNQEDFLFDRKPIMVATSAFGMGIDKSNVSFVAHYNMPLDLESYYQEAAVPGATVNQRTVCCCIPRRTCIPAASSCSAGLTKRRGWTPPRAPTCRIAARNACARWSSTAPPPTVCGPSCSPTSTRRHLPTAATVATARPASRSWI